MARARNIKPGFFESEDPAKVGFAQRLLWIALWTLADREGWLEDRPAQIRKYAFGFDEEVTAAQVDQWLAELHKAQLIHRQEFDGKKLVYILKFKKHQRPHPNEGPSTLKPSHFDPDSDLGSKHFIPKSECLQPRLEARGLNVECGMRNADGADVLNAAIAPMALPPPAPQQREFPDFGSDPDPGGLIDELVEDVAQHWPRPGNVPLAKRVWEREAAGSAKGVAGWCDSVRVTAQVHSLAHLQALKANPRHFVPDLVRWITDGDYSRPAPRVVEHGPQQRKPRFDPASLEDAI